MGWTRGNVYLALWISLIKECCSILLLNLQVAPFVRIGEDVTLVCHYDLEYDGLYSLKWYKDGKEFYSYVPRLKGTPKRFYLVDGLHVDRSMADDSRVVLRNVSLATSGDFKCQVSGEGPLFATVSSTKTLTVTVVPDLPPQVSRLPARFQPGQWLHLNCTSARSHPGARLTWIVNGEEASDDMLRKFAPVDEGGGFRTSVLGLQFWLRRGHFGPDGRLRVRCRATIGQVYFSESLNLVVGELPEDERRALQDHSRVMQATAAGQRIPANLFLLPYAILQSLRLSVQ